MNVKAGVAMRSISPTALDLSVVMPCLNEAETLGGCIEAARQAVDELQLSAEIVVADNGSTDGSQEIAERLGARVVAARPRGFGVAHQAGIAAARGRYVLTADADGQHDLSCIEPFLQKLRTGYDLVVGNRFLRPMDAGAIPWKNRYIGNPLLSALGRLLFRAPVGDFHCGMRAFRKEAYDRMGLCAAGMEFTSEMVIVAVLQGLRITEVPIPVRQSGRSRPPHLRSIRDGWRHLRLMLLLSPTALFLIPGLIFFLFGLLTWLWLWGGVHEIGPILWGNRMGLVSGFSCVVGYQLVLLGLFSRDLANAKGRRRTQGHVVRWSTVMKPEIGLVLGGVLAGIGLALVLGWPPPKSIDPNAVTVARQTIPGAVLLALGVETVFAGFFLNILSLYRK